MKSKRSQIISIGCALAVLLFTGCISKKYNIEGNLNALSVESPLPNVTLKVTNVTENLSQLVITNEDGHFLVEKVKQGQYRIESADTTAYLVSLDTFSIKEDSPQRIDRGTLRGILAPPKKGLFAWIKGSWRELSGVLVEGNFVSIPLKEARNALNVPESASLLAYFPGREWQGRDGIDWYMAVSSDSMIRFGPTTIQEKTPENEPATMDPNSFNNWDYRGVYPLRGPNFSNLYAIVEPLPSEENKPVQMIYPFWVASSQTANSQGIQLQTSKIQRNITGSILDSGVQMDIFQKALQSALASLNIPIQSITVQSSDSAILQSSSSNDLTNEQVNRWRELLRTSRADRDTFRRRQLWRAIRDSAEGTDISREADRLLMRDMNGLPLR